MILGDCGARARLFYLEGTRGPRQRALVFSCARAQLEGLSPRPPEQRTLCVYVGFRTVAEEEAVRDAAVYGRVPRHP